jgi:hypothetical protein
LCKAMRFPMLENLICGSRPTQPLLRAAAFALWR